MEFVGRFVLSEVAGRPTSAVEDVEEVKQQYCSSHLKAQVSLTALVAGLLIVVLIERK